jgi:hypothetical protein
MISCRILNKCGLMNKTLLELENKHMKYKMNNVLDDIDRRTLMEIMTC